MDYLRNTNNQIAFGSTLSNAPVHNQIQNDNVTNIGFKYNQALGLWASEQLVILNSPTPGTTNINATGNYDGSNIGLYLPTFAYAAVSSDIGYVPRFLLEWLCLDLTSGNNLDSNNFYTFRPYVATIPQTGIVSLDSPIVVNTNAGATGKRIVWNNVNYQIPINKSALGIGATRTAQLLATPSIVAYQMVGQFRLFKTSP